jgi:hypothetical protein
VPRADCAGERPVTDGSLLQLRAVGRATMSGRADRTSARTLTERCPTWRPPMTNKLLELGFEIVGNSPEEFTAFQASEFARWKKVIEVGKITAD